MKDEIIEFIKEEWSSILAVLILLFFIGIVAYSVTHSVDNALTYVDENGLKSVVERVWEGKNASNN